MNGPPAAAIYTVGSSAPPVALPSDDWVIRAIQWVSNDRIVVIAGKGAKVPGGSRHLWTVNRAVAASADGATAGTNSGASATTVCGEAAPSRVGAFRAGSASRNRITTR